MPQISRSWDGVNYRSRKIRDVAQLDRYELTTPLAGRILPASPKRAPSDASQAAQSKRRLLTR
jgi:hypothetical protein